MADINGIKIEPKFNFTFGRKNKQGQGGKGGNATVGGKGIALGGNGGRGGVGGNGGDGGDAQLKGDGFAMGGEGGEAGQPDRAAHGGRSPFEVLGIPNTQLPDGRWLWDVGRGGDGAFPAANPTQAKKEKK